MGEHPDITCAMRTGYATFQSTENQDTPESREEYIGDHMLELVRWLRLGYQEILDEFIEVSSQVCALSYNNWLN